MTRDQESLPPPEKNTCEWRRAYCIWLSFSQTRPLQHFLPVAHFATRRMLPVCEQPSHPVTSRLSWYQRQAIGSLSVVSAETLGLLDDVPIDVSAQISARWIKSIIINIIIIVIIICRWCITMSSLVHKSKTASYVVTSATACQHVALSFRCSTAPWRTTRPLDLSTIRHIPPTKHCRCVDMLFPHVAVCLHTFLQTHKNLPPPKKNTDISPQKIRPLGHFPVKKLALPTGNFSNYQLNIAALDWVVGNN